MKNLLTAAVMCLSTCCFAQVTVNRSDKLPHSDVVEKYSVLKSDKKVKQGPYTAILHNITLATGVYLNGERAGIWNFYNTKGTLIQSYNYTDNQVTYADMNDTKAMQYYVAGVKPTDVVTVPVKVGGSSILQASFFPDALAKAISNDFGPSADGTFTHIYTLSEKGAILTHDVKVTIQGFSKTYRLDDSKTNAEPTRFTPALANNKPVQSKIAITNNIDLTLETGSGDLGYYQSRITPGTVSRLN
jgi:antitoxin component YwqK of YwqJK toxin-antitoxin module